MRSQTREVIGCAENSQYKLWIPSRRKAVVSRDVTVFEDKYPAKGGALSFSGSNDIIVLTKDEEDEQPSVAPVVPVRRSSVSAPSL